MERIKTTSLLVGLALALSAGAGPQTVPRLPVIEDDTFTVELFEYTEIIIRCGLILVRQIYGAHRFMSVCRGDRILPCRNFDAIHSGGFIFIARG